MKRETRNARWLSCGARTEHPGAVRIDVRAVADVRADVTRLPFADGCFVGVECLHVLEHLLPTQALQAVREMRRVLCSGGRLEVATPDLLKCAATLLAGNLAILANIYSPDDQPAQQHRWGYTSATLRQLLATQFEHIERLPEHPSDPHEVRMAAVGEIGIRY